MKYKIVADSSSNIYKLDDFNYESVPLKIVAGENHYTDNNDLDVQAMLDDFKDYKGKSSTACPSTGEWLEAFGDADIVFGVTITSGLSGSFNAAMVAKQQYEEANPGKKVFIVDSLSAGPELTLIINKLREYMEANMCYSEIRNKILEYTNHTHLMFSLSSVENFARNGRVSPAVAKSASAFGIRVVGKASYDGKLQPTKFTRGQKKAIKKVFEEMKSHGYKGDKVIIAHTQNEDSANKLKDIITEEFTQADVTITTNGGLCSYYAEVGGILVGFES